MIVFFLSLCVIVDWPWPSIHYNLWPTSVPSLSVQPENDRPTLSWLHLTTLASQISRKLVKINPTPRIALSIGLLATLFTLSNAIAQPYNVRAYTLDACPFNVLALSDGGRGSHGLSFKGM